MQITDLTFFPSIITAIAAIIGAVLLYNIWRKQENRLTSDLPLMFSLTFVGTAANMLIHAIPILLAMEPTLILFRMRSLAIGLTIVPMAGMVFNIWLPRFIKWHTRGMLGLFAYWLAVVIIGPSEPAIILLTVPILMVFAIALTATFAITWKTGRLKEVRSDLLVVALIMAVLSQGLKVPLMNAGLDLLAYLMTMTMIVLVVLGLLNPWKKEIAPSTTTPEPLTPSM